MKTAAAVWGYDDDECDGSVYHAARTPTCAVWLVHCGGHVQGRRGSLAIARISSMSRVASESPYLSEFRQRRTSSGGRTQSLRSS